MRDYALTQAHAKDPIGFSLTTLFASLRTADLYRIHAPTTLP
jgi:hypothetical protein